MTTQIFENFAAFLARPDKSVNGVSPEFAKKHPTYSAQNAYNYGCWNCVGCDHCRNCRNCISCRDCHDCNYVAYGSELLRCVRCQNVSRKTDTYYENPYANSILIDIYSYF